MDKASVEFIEKFRLLCPANQDKIMSYLEQYELVPRSSPAPILNNENYEQSVG